jgi:translocation and assembly module TamB
VQPDQREIQVQRLGLDTRGQRWELAPRSQATVRYAAGLVEVDGLMLVSGDQTIEADGALGRPGESLHVTMTNVDLAGVDALLLREPQFSGRVDASATITGPTRAPEVEGRAQVSDGGIRQFTYDSLSTTFRYSDRGITLDARLQQNPTQWITAKGYLPLALFRSSNDPSAAADRIDFAVDSSPMDLGLIQGFTAALTQVTGTFEAHVTVGGTADDPQPSGAITLTEGNMEVEPTGVRYRHIAGEIEFLPDRVRIERLTALDNQENELSVTGELAIDRRRVDNVRIQIAADDFKVVDNEVGNVRLRTALEIGGDLRAPQLTGTLAVTTGTVNLDPIFALVGTSPYPTEPIDARASATAPAPTGPFAALTMDVTVTVPDDLVVRAASVQAPGAPVGLGALNVTLGGDLRATKERGGPILLMGAVNTVRGTYDFQGRRFEILRDGAIRFTGGDELDPALDIRTRRLIQGVEARVNVRGTLRKPQIELSSTPPLEEADILSLIVFNQPVNQLGEGQQISLAARAQSLAVGAVAGQIAQSIGRALNLDTFEIQVAPETGSDAEVTIGEQLGQDLYVRVQQGIGNHATTNFILEYELTEWLRLQTNFVQGSNTQPSVFRRAQGTGVDLILFLSY